MLIKVQFLQLVSPFDISLEWQWSWSDTFYEGKENFFSILSPQIAFQLLNIGKDMPQLDYDDFSF